MTRLRACYPIHVIDEELWESNVLRYQEELRHYPAPILARVFESAWKRHPIHFPALGQLDELCRIATKQAERWRPELPCPRDAATDAAKERASAYIDAILEGTTTPYSEDIVAARKRNKPS